MSMKKLGGVLARGAGCDVNVEYRILGREEMIWNIGDSLLYMKELAVVRPSVCPLTPLYIVGYIKELAAVRPSVLLSTSSEHGCLLLDF